MQVKQENEVVIGDEPTLNLYSKFFKRLIDLGVSSISLIILCIPFLVIACFIKADSKGPVFFKQVRMGKNNVPFNIIKFRSMYQDAPHDVATSKLIGAERHITRVGRFLRKSSLDELPQLINVFKGNMSLVGPRPLILKEKKVLSLRRKNGANKVLPGITGLAQIHGRDEVNDLKKAKLDKIYTDSISFSMDCKILIHTFCDVIKSRGIHEGKQ